MLTLSELFDLQHTDHKPLFHGITYPWEVISKIEAYILEYLKKSGEEGSDIIIGEGTRIDSLARIIGPAIIGKRSWPVLSTCWMPRRLLLRSCASIAFI